MTIDPKTWEIRHLYKGQHWWYRWYLFDPDGETLWGNHGRYRTRRGAEKFIQYRKDIYGPTQRLITRLQHEVERRQ